MGRNERIEGQARGGGESSLRRTLDVYSTQTPSRGGSVTLSRNCAGRNVTNVFTVSWAVTRGRGWQQWSKKFDRRAGRTAEQREAAAAEFAAGKLERVSEWVGREVAS